MRRLLSLVIIFANFSAFGDATELVLPTTTISVAKVTLEDSKDKPLRTYRLFDSEDREVAHFYIFNEGAPKLFVDGAGPNPNFDFKEMDDAAKKSIIEILQYCVNKNSVATITLGLFPRTIESVHIPTCRSTAPPGARQIPVEPSHGDNG